MYTYTKFDGDFLSWENLKKKMKLKTKESQNSVHVCRPHNIEYVQCDLIIICYCNDPLASTILKNSNLNFIFSLEMNNYQLQVLLGGAKGNVFTLLINPQTRLR